MGEEEESISVAKQSDDVDNKASFHNHLAAKSERVTFSTVSSLPIETSSLSPAVASWNSRRASKASAATQDSHRLTNLFVHPGANVILRTAPSIAEISAQPSQPTVGSHLTVPQGAASRFAGDFVLNAARGSERTDRTDSDFNSVLFMLDPAEMTNEDLEYWTKVIARKNENAKTETWMFERFFRRAVALNPRVFDSEKRHSESMTVLQEFDEICHGPSQKDTATFKTFTEQMQETRARAASSISKQYKISQGALTVSAFDINSKKTQSTTATSLGLPETRTDLNMDEKMEIAVAEVRKMKEEKAERKMRHESLCLNMNSSIQQHKEHLEIVKKYRRLFTREQNRGGQKIRLSGDAIVKFYDDVIKDGNHSMEVIRLSNSNLKSKYKSINDSLKVREEQGGDAYKLVGYQQLELISEELQQTHTSQLAVSAALKQKLGDCNFFCNRGRKRLEEAEVENKKLRREIFLRKATLAHIENESEAVKVSFKELTKELKENQTLERDYVKPDLMSYVREVSANQDLEREVRIWQRRIHLLEFSLGELSRTLASLQSRIGVNSARSPPPPFAADAVLP